MEQSRALLKHSQTHNTAKWPRRRIMLRSKKVFALAFAVIVLAVAGIALAFYGGSGTSAPTNAKAGASPVGVSVSVDTSNAQALYPGDAAATLPITISSIGNRSAHVGSVTLSMGSLPAGCSASWFTLTNPSTGFGTGANVTPGNPLTVNGSIQFVESGTAQDACSLANLPITATANPTP